MNSFHNRVSLWYISIDIITSEPLHRLTISIQIIHNKDRGKSVFSVSHFSLSLGVIFCVPLLIWVRSKPAMVAWHLPASFNLTSLRSSLAYLLSTSPYRTCFRTWLLAKLVSVTKVVNQNIEGYRFNATPGTDYKKNILSPTSVASFCNRNCLHSLRTIGLSSLSVYKRRMWLAD